jgi:hypothetical protein
MQTQDLKIVDGGAAGAWIEQGLGGDFGAVTLQVPEVYEAYARIFHPASDRESNRVRWAEVAEARGKTAHREMQWESLVAGSEWDGQEPMTGWIDVDDLDALCQILAAHTTEPDHCYFGLCTIQSWEKSFSADELKPLLRLPMGRDHIVLAGPLTAVDQISRDYSSADPGSAVSVAWKGNLRTPGAPQRSGPGARRQT